jgi:threonine/homoserine/homoserine lactone efflux protein
MSFLEVLPLAFVMIAGPQIISSFFLATSSDWAKCSAAFIAGAAVSVTTFVTIAYFVGKGVKSAGSKQSGTGDKILDWVVLVLLVVLAVRTFLGRKTSQPPKWMGKLQDATPRFAFTLGLLLLGVFPTDILTSVTVGLHVARKEDPWWQCLPFVGATLLLLGIPSITVVLLGRRGPVVLPKIRDWMNGNSWIISEVVLVFFAAITINSLAGG